MDFMRKIVFRWPDGEEYPMLMQHKVCVVTGAASPHGIGRATARMLAANGANVGLIDISENVNDAARDIAAEYPASAILGVRCNIASTEACEEAAAKVSRTFNRVDALIHCAGVIRSGKYDEISDKDFDEVIAVNLAGAFRIIRSFTTTMVAQRKGSIVNVASVAAQRGGGLVGGLHYAASKGGVLSLTKSLARELGPVGVRVNAVCPSLIETDFVTSAISKDHIRDLTSGIPLGRPGRPDEVAAACMFLASDLSSYITGATLDVNGGSHIH
jgi:NAD(P)-dependent dehydrogenase (short-subunit alcohol dehydrogenase family)